MEQLAKIAMARLNLIVAGSLNEVISNEIREILNKMIDACKAFDGTLISLVPGQFADDFANYWKGYGVGEWEMPQLKIVWASLDEEVLDYVGIFNDFCEIQFGRSLSIDDVTHLRNILYILSLTGSIASTMKVLVNVLFAKHFQTEMPEVPDGYLGRFLFPRWLNNRFKQLKVRARSQNSRRDGSKVYSLFQGMKKGFLPIRPDAIDKSLLKHKEALTKDPSCDEEILDYMHGLLDEEFSQIPRKMSNAWRWAKEPAMSSKSTVECSMAGCGQVGFGHILLHLSDVEVSDLASFSEIDRVDLIEAKGPILTPPDCFVGFARDSLRATSPIVVRNHYMDSDFEIREVLTYFRSCRARDEEGEGGDWENYLVQPAVVLEPMKGRIITKPAVGSYMNWGRLQKALWKSLKAYDQFQLVGRPVEEEDIWYVAGSWELGMGFNSGDFSGATDNLKGAVSSLILRYLLSRIPPEELLKIERSFCNTSIDYRKIPVKYGKKELGSLYKWKCTEQGIVSQRNGQLMGHILSFPILCIANYLIFRYAYDRILRRKAPNVRVNGDDILFCCYPDEYKVWCEQTARIGFSPSLGKNLYQADIAQINSVLFRIGFGEVEDRRFVRKIEVIPYLNMGIIKMRGKGKEVQRAGAPGDKEIEDYLPVMRPIYRMLDGPWDKELAQQKFWRDHRELRGTLKSVKIPLSDIEYLPDKLWQSMVSSEASPFDSIIAQRYSSISLSRNDSKLINIRKRIQYFRSHPIDFSVVRDREDFIWA